MRAADTSLVVAAFASWHQAHEQARRALDKGVRLVGHCALETYSVLTRLPPPHRAPAEVVRDFLALRFPEPYLQMGAGDLRDFLRGLPAQGITGGAAYDALVAATAASNAAELVTCDHRAASIYERYGVRAHIL